MAFQNKTLRNSMLRRLDEARALQTKLQTHLVEDRQGTLPGVLGAKHKVLTDAVDTLNVAINAYELFLWPERKT